MNLCGLDYVDYWLNCIHAFTASYSAGGSATAAGASSTAAAVVGRLSPAVFIVGTNRASLNNDADQQLQMVSVRCDDSCLDINTCLIIICTLSMHTVYEAVEKLCSAIIRTSMMRPFRFSG